MEYSTCSNFINDQLKWSFINLYALFSFPNEMLGNQLANKILTISLTERINNYLTILLYCNVQDCTWRFPKMRHLHFDVLVFACIDIFCMLLTRLSKLQMFPNYTYSTPPLHYFRLVFLLTEINRRKTEYQLE